MVNLGRGRSTKRLNVPPEHRLLYQGLAVPDNIGVSQVGHAEHCGQPASQQPEIDAFIKKFLLGQSVDTKINNTDGTYTFDQAKWVDWTVPTLD